MIPVLALVRPEMLVELTVLDELNGGGPALLDLLLLVEIGGGRQHDAGSWSRLGFSSAWRRVKSGFLLSFVLKCPWTWQVRMRTSSMTGVFEASESSKPSSTIFTMVSRLGRGSSSQICDFIANAWERSCMIEEPSP